jgi:hypothetical protein
MSKTNTDQVIKIDGTILPITPKNPKKGYSLQEMYLAIDTIMVCDEEAMYNSQSYNALASMIPGQPILGDVLVCNTKNVK